MSDDLRVGPGAPQEFGTLQITHQFTAEQRAWYNTLSPKKRAFVIREMEAAAAAACHRAMRGAR